MAALRDNMSAEISRRVVGEVMTGRGDAAQAEATDSDTGDAPRKNLRNREVE
jgi:hypothetical protein